MSVRPRVQGHCPMGCGETLELWADGAIVCSSLECLEPRAVTVILRDTESEHIVDFTEGGFVSRHPLWERCYSNLTDCTFQEKLANSLNGPPVPPGTYRVVRRGDQWHYTPVPKEAING